MKIDDGALVVHIAAGSVALLTFWLPWVVKKGGLLHRRVGMVYAGAMAVVAITGLVISTIRLMDGEPGNDSSAAFLGSVGLLAGATASMGVRSVRTKRRTEASRNGWDLGVAGMLSVAGLATLALAVRERSVLFGVFGALALFSGAGQLRFWLRPPVSRTAWLLEHIGGMGASCISTVTAFLVVNVERLGLEPIAIVLWIAPGVLGGVGIALWQARYRRPAARPATA